MAVAVPRDHTRARTVLVDRELAAPTPGAHSCLTSDRNNGTRAAAQRATDIFASLIVLHFQRRRRFVTP